MKSLQVGQKVKKAVFNRTTQEYEYSTVTITKITRKFIFCGYDKYLRKDGIMVDCYQLHKTHLILDEVKHGVKKSKSELTKWIKANLDSLSHNQLLEISKIIGK